MTKASEPEVRLRTTAIHLLRVGHRPGQGAQMLLVKVDSIYNWHRRWQRLRVRIEKLEITPRRDRNKTKFVSKEVILNTDQRDLFFESFERTPKSSLI